MGNKQFLNENKIKYLIVHCSDTSNSDTAMDIHKLHLDFGWNGIGYHKIILRNGKIENGRPDYWIGAHVKNFNSESIGICLIGKTNFTKKQFHSLKKILTNYKIKYPNSKILGHRDVTNTHKTCPNFDVRLWCKKENLN